MSTPRFTFVLFGATGDLAMRKILPALYSAHLGNSLQSDGSILCVSNQDIGPTAFKETVSEQLPAWAAPGRHTSEGAASFLNRIDYVKLDATRENQYAELASRLPQDGRVKVFYLATAPSLFEPICRNLAAHVELADARVVLEKPLGNDLLSSRTINDAVACVFSENQIYRIDHYLGKESVQNLLALRFGNSLFEPLWRREAISHIQLTIAEELGVERRGEFYDATGALRDMVQNHLLQLLCMVAMEPPTSLNADAVRDEKLRVLRALKPLTANDLERNVVRGQYTAGAVRGKAVPGYQEEACIASGSHTETFIALHAEINNWRWAGVPFFLRTGKRLQQRMAEIVITFKPVPYPILPLPAGLAGEVSNRLVIRLQPEESIKLHCLAKQPGDGMKLQPVVLDLALDKAFGERREDAYERLLLDAIRGNLALFVRRDEQEAAWHWVEPILEMCRSTPFAPKFYTAGTWGPAASSALLSRAGFAWHEER
ncbi:glucose-6-phosphate dehydrogenase [Noviherbaspirillum aerium]|uniref:glucose-6-phosphate dehydrogenase n=1 Tax=Noviherbaspirillum aerium TaxID=2588497 RepID=UPI00124DC609|nr:glucose-6-phosphate dehydrogenase [Noviherbaspirillum aerium]